MRTFRRVGLTLATMMLVLASASPSVAQSPAPAASGALAPAWVTGTIRLAPSCDEPAVTIMDGIRQERGARCGPQTWVTSDPRLSGSAVASWNTDVYADVPGTGSEAGGIASVWTSRYEVTNDDGSWACWATYGLDLGLDSSGVELHPETLACEGAGAYDGLMAILVLPETDRSITGFIFPGEVPPIP